MDDVSDAAYVDVLPNKNAKQTAKNIQKSFFVHIFCL
jgi:hypothetical protein